jgi:sugar lactone lactonase YvrE
MERSTTTVAGGFLLPEGPRWHDGSLWFVDMLRGNVNRMTDGRVETVASFDHPASLGFRSNGDLLVTDSNTRLLHTLRDEKVVHSLDLGWLSNGRINDMAVDRHGRAYIDDTGGGDPFRDGWQAHGRILLVFPDGSGRVGAEGILSPNGIAISPDGRTLVVGESMGPGGAPTGARLLGYDIADDGSLANQRLVGTIARGSGDGLCFDSEGAVWVGTSFGHEVQRFVDGEVVERIEVAERRWALACALGGPDLTTMFICTTARPLGGDPGKFTDGWIETVEVDVPGFVVA